MFQMAPMQHDEEKKNACNFCFGFHITISSRFRQANKNVSVIYILNLSIIYHQVT